MSYLHYIYTSRSFKLDFYKVVNSQALRQRLGGVLTSIAFAAQPMGDLWSPTKRVSQSFRACFGRQRFGVVNQSQGMSWCIAKANWMKGLVKKCQEDSWVCLIECWWLTERFSTFWNFGTDFIPCTNTYVYIKYMYVNHNHGTIYSCSTWW